MGKNRSNTKKNEFWAFISYSSDDKKFAEKLHRRMEGFSIPKQFRNIEIEGRTVGKRLRPIFRDRDELSSSTDVGETLDSNIEKSHCLLVLCSPTSAKAPWVESEIEKALDLARIFH